MSPLLLAILAGTALASTKRQETPSLHALFTAAGKDYFGAIADTGTLQDAQNTAVIQANFGQLTHENSLKWESVEPEEGVFNFDGPDQLMAFAGENDILVRGHTLVWHSQLPAWVEEIQDAETLTQVMQNHISEVVGRYKGQIFAWVRQFPPYTLSLSKKETSSALEKCKRLTPNAGRRQRDFRGGRLLPRLGLLQPPRRGLCLAGLQHGTRGGSRCEALHQ